MIYSPAHRLLFLKTMKTAGTSIEIELSRHVDDDAVLTRIDEEEMRFALSGRTAQNHDRPMTLREMSPRQRLWSLVKWRRPRIPVYRNHMTAAAAKTILPAWDDLSKICVVRNPWDVVASRFEQERKRSGIQTVDEFFERFGVTSNWDIYAIGGTIAVDHVVGYERLSDDLPHAFRAVGIELGTLPLAKSGAGRNSYRKLFSDEQAARIACVCKSEIDAFGYSY